MFTSPSSRDYTFLTPLLISTTRIAISSLALPLRFPLSRLSSSLYPPCPKFEKCFADALRLRRLDMSVTRSPNSIASSYGQNLPQSEPVVLSEPIVAAIDNFIKAAQRIAKKNGYEHLQHLASLDEQIRKNNQRSNVFGLANDSAVWKLCGSSNKRLFTKIHDIAANTHTEPLRILTDLGQVTCLDRRSVNLIQEWAAESSNREQWSTIHTRIRRAADGRRTRTRDISGMRKDTDSQHILESDVRYARQTTFIDQEPAPTSGDNFVFYDINNTDNKMAGRRKRKMDPSDKSYRGKALGKENTIASEGEAEDDYDNGAMVDDHESEVSLPGYNRHLLISQVESEVGRAADSQDRYYGSSPMQLTSPYEDKRNRSPSPLYFDSSETPSKHKTPHKRLKTADNSPINSFGHDGAHDSDKDLIRKLPAPDDEHFELPVPRGDREIQPTASQQMTELKYVPFFYLVTLFIFLRTDFVCKTEMEMFSSSNTNMRTEEYPLPVLYLNTSSQKQKRVYKRCQMIVCL